MNGQQEYVDFAREASVATVYEAFLGAHADHSLAILNPHISLRMIAKNEIRKFQLPTPNYLVTHLDRSRSADYSLMDVEKWMPQRVEAVKRVYAQRQVDFDLWKSGVSRVERIVRDIQSRGGKVVFVRFPTSGERRTIEETAYPKTQYWDKVARLTSATTVHFEDVPALSGFQCPDMSHLDCRDAPLFTRRLLDELARLSVLPQK
jgi:hypothetical protein